MTYKDINSFARNPRLCAISHSLMVFILTGCQAFNTFNKYANLRLYEVYRIDGVSACDYKPKFNECTDDKRTFNLKISDDKSKVALVTQNKYAYFGFTRDDYQRQTQPLRDFLLWYGHNS